MPEPAIHYSIQYTKDDKEDKLIAIFCLYEDLDNMRKFVSELWKGYRYNQKDPVNISITTQAAFEMAISLEAKLVEQYPALTNCQKIFGTLLHALMEKGSNALW